MAGLPAWMHPLAPEPVLSGESEQREDLFAVRAALTSQRLPLRHAFAKPRQVFKSGTAMGDADRRKNVTLLRELRSQPG